MVDSESLAAIGLHNCFALCCKGAHVNSRLSHAWGARGNVGLLERGTPSQFQQGSLTVHPAEPGSRGEGSHTALETHQTTSPLASPSHCVPSRNSLFLQRQSE